MKINTNDLRDIALDWATAIASGTVKDSSELSAQTFLGAHSRGAHHFSAPGAAADSIICGFGIDTRLIKPASNHVFDARHFDPSKGDVIFMHEEFKREMVKRPAAPRALDNQWLAQPSTGSSSATPHWSLKIASSGRTATEAAMRCFVQAQIGPSIEIPDLIAQHVPDIAMTTQSPVQPTNPLNNLIDKLGEYRLLLEKLASSYGPLDSAASSAKSGLSKLLDAAEKLQDKAITLPDFQKSLAQANPVTYSVEYFSSAAGRQSNPDRLEGIATLTATLPDGSTFTNTQGFAQLVSDPKKQTLLSSTLDIEHAREGLEIVSFDENSAPVTVEGDAIDKTIFNSIPALKNVQSVLEQTARLRGLKALAQECLDSNDQESIEVFTKETNLSPTEFIRQVEIKGYTSEVASIVAPTATAIPPSPTAESIQEKAAEKDDGPSLG